VKKPKKPVRRRPVMTFIRRQQILAFYVLCRDGAYIGREDERDAVQEMLFAASKAGVIK